MILLSTACLDLLLSNLSGFSNLILWVRTGDFKKQLYISESFLKIYGYSLQEAYENPIGWTKSIDTSERHEIIDRVSLRINNYLSNKDENEPIYYKVFLPNGEVNFIKNIAIPLKDTTGRIFSFMGLSENIPEQEWELLKNRKLPDNLKSNTLIKDLSSLLKKDLKADKYSSSPNLPSPLTQREIDCLNLTANGKSAKEIARHFNISHRTIEVHLASIKRKLNCKTKLELLSILNSSQLNFN